jgi:hypothetical protein
MTDAITATRVQVCYAYTTAVIRCRKVIVTSPGASSARADYPPVETGLATVACSGRAVHCRHLKYVCAICRAYLAKLDIGPIRASDLPRNAVPEFRAVIGARERAGGNGPAEEFAERSPPVLYHIDEQHPNLYVEIAHAERVSLDKIASWLHFVAHQRGKNLVRRNRILDLHFHQTAHLWIHGGFP